MNYWSVQEDEDSNNNNDDNRIIIYESLFQHDRDGIDERYDE